MIGVNMSLKEKVRAIRQARKPGRFVIPGYDTNDVLNTLFSYVDEMESGASEVESLRVKVGILEAKIDSGPDGKFGTKDDKVTLSRVKKSSAKPKVEAKKTPARRKTAAKKK